MKVRSLPTILTAIALPLAIPVFTQTAHAESKLEIQVITASPGGFLVTATIVSGEKEAILIDSALTLADAHRVVGALLDSKKSLTTVYVTHAHPDHYFGLEVIKQAFPKAKLVALPATIAEIKETWQGKVKQWSPMYGDNLTSHPVIPSPLKGTTLTVDGQTLEVHGGVQGDAPNNSYVWIPSIKTVIAGDIVYAGVYPWTAETNVDTRKAWLKTLGELAALAPTTVVAGHKEPAHKDDATAINETRAYLRVFDEVVAASKSAGEVESKMKAKYPKLALDVILHIGATAQFPAAAVPAGKPATK
jgi:glyoxylase-like metal-dependent hydrolase (beta-lactamase superfamily II)